MSTEGTPHLVFIV